MNTSIKYKFLFLLLAFYQITNAQNYHGLNGSPYFGVSNIYVNPASSVNSFYKWDATIIGFQFNTNQNTFSLKNANFKNLNSFTDSSLKISDGFNQRYYHGIMDLQGLSFRYKLDDKKAIAFSIRGRTYNHFKSNNLFYTDSIKYLESFLKTNLVGSNIDVFATTSSWLETNFNYSQILIDEKDTRLSVGANIGFIKAMAGGRFSIDNVKFNRFTDAGVYYRPLSGNLSYMYSDNLTLLDTNNVTKQIVKDYYKKSLNTFSLSFGVEYFINDEDAIEDVSTTNYTWKLGASILDIGRAKYEYAQGSAINTNPNVSFTDTVLTAKFDNIKKFKNFRDSLSRLFDNTDSLQGNFYIGLPTRLVLNVDRKIANQVYLNASATINLRSVSSKEKYNTRELHLLSLSPRWESQLFGFYLPMQLTTEGNFYMGAACKIGPLILGVHDLSFFNWFKTQNQNINGGAYCMLNIYPYKSKKRNSGEIDCPKY